MARAPPWPSHCPAGPPSVPAGAAAAEMVLGCRISPSILNSDLAALGAECSRMLDCGADCLHLDVTAGSGRERPGRGEQPERPAPPLPAGPGCNLQAGMSLSSAPRHFIPNITFGHPVMECLRKWLGQEPFFDMHMMVATPEQWVKPMAVAGANQYTLHLEATGNPRALIKDIRENGMKVQWLRTQFPSLDIEEDGGVGPDTIHKYAEAGANMIVSGSAIMKSADPRSVINLLRNVCSEAVQKCSLDR
ncbi:ribulose-phosphate 3-epimerase-like [Corvus cornix cornix]|uniref:ribulose-phosphate 3-epimerase-like n=1 Tax=Corvus cornix cornix TaxID=932674 RepID=UPI00195046B0|nr:ribulose-phosphate 3-epimerase-like [Corvus cornix cornix]